eukprot:gb/GECG01003968.1/.p1 GENE.gb/GECG01003968.1/~~gb/GECG01003968.1/.p1  ORF type:complete len:546 (+),score=102.90 gb/GECG01003968.1/:1-1638(+)
MTETQSTQEKENGTIQQPQQEAENLWLTLLKDARESAQETLERDGTCWILGPPGSGKRCLIQALKEEARALHEERKKSQKGESKDSSSSSKKRSETHQRHPSEEHTVDNEYSGHHQPGKTPFVCELSSPYYTYFQTDGSEQDSEGPGKTHCWVADALHLLPSLQTSADYRSPFNENTQVSGEAYSLPIILTLDASRPWELSAQLNTWAHYLVAALKEMEKNVPHHLIVCLNKMDTLVRDSSFQNTEESERKWTEVLPDSMKLSSREIDIVQKELRKFCLQNGASLVFHSSRERANTRRIFELMDLLHQGSKVNEMHEKAQILHEEGIEGRLFVPWGVDTTKLIEDIGIDETDTLKNLPTPPGVTARAPRDMGVLQAQQHEKQSDVSVKEREEESRVITESMQTSQEWLKNLADQLPVHRPKESYASFLEDVFRHVQDIAVEEQARETKDATEDSKRGSVVSKSAQPEEDDEVTFNIKPKRKARTATPASAATEGQESQDAASVASGEDSAASSDRGKPAKRSTRSQNPQHFFQRLREGGKSSQKK